MTKTSWHEDYSQILSDDRALEGWRKPSVPEPVRVVRVSYEESYEPLPLHAPQILPPTRFQTWLPLMIGAVAFAIYLVRLWMVSR